MRVGFSLCLAGRTTEFSFVETKWDKLRGKKQRTFEDASLTAAAGSQVFQAKLTLKLLESVVLFHVMKMKCVSLPGSNTVKQSHKRKSAMTNVILISHVQA